MMSFSTFGAFRIYPEVPLSSPDQVCVVMRSSKHASVRLRYCSTGFTNLKEENQPIKGTARLEDYKVSFTLPFSTTLLIYAPLMCINKQN